MVKLVLKTYVLMVLIENKIVCVFVSHFPVFSCIPYPCILWGRTFGFFGSIYFAFTFQRKKKSLYDWHKAKQFTHDMPGSSLTPSWYHPVLLKGGFWFVFEKKYFQTHFRNATAKWKETGIESSSIMIIPHCWFKLNVRLAVL